MNTDPQPVINPYRICTFIVAVCSALALLEVIPAEVKPWLVVISLVISLALTVFFKVGDNAPANPSIAARIQNKLSGPQ